MLALLSMAGKKAGDLTDDELSAVASTIGGEDPSGLLALFKMLRDAEPGVKVTELLSTPSANAVLRAASDRLAGATEEKEGGLFCRCPNCDFPFISE